MLISISNSPPFSGTVLLFIYALILGYTIIKILLDTHATSKTLAYLLLVIVLPLLGVIIYFSFGTNYRHRKIDKKGIASDNEHVKAFKKNVADQTDELLKSHAGSLKQYSELARFIYNLGNENLSKNEYKLLVNGEEKFPEVLKTLDTAKHFIHMEYYDWENDVRGNQIKDILLEKIKEGVTVRVMYDAYASRKIKHNIVKELRQGGAEIHPVIKVEFVNFANRMNHRDHRKVIIIDAKVGFVGGINISDRYDNSIDTGLYWRDTHIKITGETVHNLQRHFIVNWNSSLIGNRDISKKGELIYGEDLFPKIEVSESEKGNDLAQIVAGGPIYPLSNIMLTYFKIFTLATKKLYITNPYFIPSEGILDALKQAALSGVDVRLMVPKKSDSAVVGAASKFYFEQLLEAGVKIYLYRKGFVHAKTVVADEMLSVVGTANMDIRSFELNFEIMSVIYGNKTASQLEAVYLNDLKECDELNYKDWVGQSTLKKVGYAISRLVSSFL